MTNLNEHIKQQQEVNRGKAEEAVFPIPLSLLKLPKEDVKRVDEEIYKVIDTLTADTIKKTLKWVKEIVGRHHKNGCDEKYRDECLEMILEEITKLDDSNN